MNRLNLKVLTFLYAAMISVYCFSESTGPQRMGDRYTISNTLYNNFHSSTLSSGQDQKLKDILFKNILSKNSIFGAPCDPYEAGLKMPEFQTGSTDNNGVVAEETKVLYFINKKDLHKNCYSANELLAPPKMTSSISASALILKTCTEIMCECDYSIDSNCSCGANESAMKENAFVSAALTKVCKDSDGNAIEPLSDCTLNDTTALNTLRLFHPFYASLPADLSGLSSGGVSLVSFLYAVCIDPSWR